MSNQGVCIDYGDGSSDDFASSAMINAANKHIIEDDDALMSLLMFPREKIVGQKVIGGMGVILDNANIFETKPGRLVSRDGLTTNQSIVRALLIIDAPALQSIVRHYIGEKKSMTRSVVPNSDSENQKPT